MNRLLKAVTAMMLLATVFFTMGCNKDPNDNNGNEGGNSGGGAEEGLYLGIIGFNDQLKTKPIGLLNESTENSVIGFINDLDMRDGTALYHANITALNWLQKALLPPDLINVSIVTFTDGLDNVSMMLNDNYGSQTEFLDAINNRIKTDKVGGLKIDAYAVGMKGNDVQDYEGFQRNLQKLSSSPSNVFEVENMDYVTIKFREIATRLSNEATTYVGTKVKIPGGYDNNSVIRITFDNVDNVNNSSRYIEGTYSRENGKGKLSNIVYTGLHSISGSMIVSEKQDGTYYWFTFEELKTTEGLPISNTANMKLWRYVASIAEWQPESEFTPSNYSEIQVDYKSAIIVLVLDCTTSLGHEDFNKMKSAAKEFVNVLGQYGNGNPNDNVDIPMVNTEAVSGISTNSAHCEGVILNTGGAEISYRGICWSTDKYPTLEDSYVIDEQSQNNQISCQITKLEAGTTYYFRAFAMNRAGVGYGNQMSFTTMMSDDPDVPVGRAYTIDEILELQPGTVFNEPASVNGIVTGDEVSGNLYKAAYIQDRQSGNALEITFTASTNIHIGDSIRLYIEGAMFGDYHGLPMLSGIDPVGHVAILARNCPIEPKLITVYDLNANLVPPGSLIRLENMRFIEHTTFADIGNYSYANRTLVEVDNPNNSVIVRTSNYADFATDTLPNRACNLIAIASIYNTTWQLIIRFRDEIEEFGGPFPGHDGEINYLPYEQYFTTSFGSFSTYNVLGTQAWAIDYNTAKMTGFESETSHANEDWLISAPVAITGVPNAKMTIDYIGRYFNKIDSDVTFWISTDYEAGEHPATATWTQLPARLSLGTNWNSFMTTEIDLTNYLGQIVTVAVRYISDDLRAGTIEIRKISIKGGVAVPPASINVFVESFEESVGNFSIIDVVLPDSLTYIWTHLPTYSCMLASAYKNDISYTSESWLVSPAIELDGVSASMYFQQAVKFATPQEFLSVMVSANYNGDVTTANWTELELSAWPSGNNWIFTTSGADLSAFAGQTVNIAFKYTSTENASPSWEVKNVCVSIGL